MARLNLTLDADTEAWLEKHARRSGTGRASLARELLMEAVARREKLLRARRMAADYSAGRPDSREVLDEMEIAQLELLDE